MTVTKTLDGDTLTIAADGWLDTITAPQFNEEVQDLNGAKNVILDFENLDYISSAGLRETVMLFRRVSGNGGDFSVRRAKKEVYNVFALTGFLSGISGLIYSSRIMSNDSNNAGINYETDAILSVVIGGTSMSGGKFSLSGTIVGSIIIRTIITFVYYFGVSPDSTMAFKAMIIAVIIVLQSEPVRNWMAKRSMARSQAKAMARGGVQ